MNRRTCGFTVVEVAVAIAVLGVLLVSIGSVTHSVTHAVGFELVELEAQEVGESTTSALGRNLARARLLEVKTEGTEAPSLTFVILVDVGEDNNGNLALDSGEDANGNDVLDLSDGDFTAPDGSVQWGAIEDDGPRLDMPGSPHQITLRYVADEDIDEADRGYDLNGDGDQTDVFQRGHLLYTTTGGRTEQYGRGAVLAQTDSPQADLNNDGVADPLFLIEGENFVDSDGNGIRSHGESFTDANGNEIWDGRIRLNLWVFKEYEGTRFTLRNYTTTWELSDVD